MGLVQELLGYNINRQRHLLGFSVEKLAEEARVSPGNLLAIIHGRKWVSAEMLEKISRALRIPVHVLFLPENGPTTEVSVLISELGSELEKEISNLVKATTTEYMERANK